MERQKFVVEFAAAPVDDYSNYPTPVGPDDERANLTSSIVEGGHAPALDLDVPARLIPSSTPGHSHLYIDVPMPWDKYVNLLVALKDAGILEPGYVEASIRQGATFLRLPGVMKELNV